jgi:hypothetical protein
VRSHTAAVDCCCFHGVGKLPGVAVKVCQWLLLLSLEVEQCLVVGLAVGHCRCAARQIVGFLEGLELQNVSAACLCSSMCQRWRVADVLLRVSSHYNENGEGD